MSKALRKNGRAVRTACGNGALTNDPDCCGEGPPPPPPPPPPACCNTNPCCCHITSTPIRITVQAQYDKQAWGCNNNANCGPVGWKSLTITGSGSALYAWQGAVGNCCPDTANYQDRIVGLLTTTYDLPEGPPCGGGVQSTAAYPVSVLIVSGLEGGVMKTWIWVKAKSKIFIFPGCASGSQTNNVNGGTSFSSSCGTSPQFTERETITITVEGLAGCGGVGCTGGGGGGGGGAGRPEEDDGGDGDGTPPDGGEVTMVLPCTGCGKSAEIEAVEVSG